MPRSVTASFRKEAEAIFSPEADLCFLTISHPLLLDPIRVNWDTKDYIYGGKTFTGFPFEITIYSDDESPPKAQLTIQNVDSRIGETVRSLATPPRLKLELLSTLDFDTTVTPRTEIGTANVVYSFDRAFLTNCKVDFLAVTAEIEGWNYLQRVWPGKRGTQDLLPGLFR